MTRIHPFVDLIRRAWAWLNAFFSDRQKPIISYAITGGVLTALPVGSLIALHGLLTNTMFLSVQSVVHPWPLPGPPLIGFVVGLADIAIFTPLVETGLAFVPIWILRRIGVSEFMVPLIAAFLWALAHCRGEHWGHVVQAWPFFCFTCILMQQEKTSLDRAWVRASAVHSAHNIIGLLWGLPVALLSA